MPTQATHFGDCWTLGEVSAEKNNGKLDDRHTVGLSPYDMTLAADPRIPYCYNNIRLYSMVIYQSFGNWPHAKGGEGKKELTKGRGYSESQRCGNTSCQKLSYY
jgi:hypothetical protein